MRQLAVLSSAVVAACFAQPTPPSPDAGATCGAWSATPTELLLPSGGEAGDNGPWLSDDRTELWFARVWDTVDHDVMRSGFSGGGWGSAEQPINLNNGQRQDDPFVDDQGVLWYASGTVGSMIIYNAQRTDGDVGLTTAEMHIELGNAFEPALAPGALAIYYSTDNITITRATRPIPKGAFDTPTPLSFARHIESPSIDRNGTTIYFTDHGSTPSRISHGELVADAIMDEGIVGTFQSDPAADYFDPSVSHDGQTLVYASTTGGGIHLFYVTRDCTP